MTGDFLLHFMKIVQRLRGPDIGTAVEDRIDPFCFISCVFKARTNVKLKHR